VGDFTGIQTLKKKLVAGQKKGCSGKEQGGRRVFVEGKQNDAVLWVFFKIFFYSNKGILVTLYPKTTSFWVFHPFSWFHLTEGVIL
jgi:hypothetical protein